MLRKTSCESGKVFKTDASFTTRGESGTSRRRHYLYLHIPSERHTQQQQPGKEKEKTNEPRRKSAQRVDRITGLYFSNSAERGKLAPSSTTNPSSSCCFSFPVSFVNVQTENERCMNIHPAHGPLCYRPFPSLFLRRLPNLSFGMLIKNLFI